MTQKIKYILILILFPLIFLFCDGYFSRLILTDYNYGIIYGNTVFPDGTPSPRLTARLQVGKELYDDKKIQTIIVSGGIGKEGHDEAEVMGKFLMKNGIPQENIIIDSDGYTTKQTSENAFKIISDREEDMTRVSVIGISQWFHISRVKLSLRQASLKNVSGQAPFYFELRDIYSLVREIPAYIQYTFFS